MSNITIIDLDSLIGQLPKINDTLIEETKFNMNNDNKTIISSILSLSINSNTAHTDRNESIIKPLKTLIKKNNSLVNHNINRKRNISNSYDNSRSNKYNKSIIKKAIKKFKRNSINEIKEIYNNEIAIDSFTNKIVKIIIPSELC